MHHNSNQNYIKTNTLLFAQNACQSILDMAGIEFVLKEESFKEVSFSTSHKMIVYIHFSGTIQGEYIFSIDETLAAALIGMPASDIYELREDYTDFLKELLNLSVSQSILELEKSFGNLTFSSSTVIFGEIKFPAVRSGIVSIIGLNSEIECGFSLNLAELKIGQEFEKALRDLEIKTLEINEANKNIKNILELVPSGLAAIDSKFKILPGYSKSTALVVGYERDKEIIGLNIVEFLSLKIKDNTELLTWLDTVFKKFGEIPFENLISQCNQNEVTNKYGKILKLNWLPVFSDKEKKLERLLVIIEDVSDQRRLEATIRESSHAISSEFILSKLLSKLMQITMENTDADNCVLILEKNGKFFIEAKTLTDDSFDILNNKIIKSVIETKQNILINDEANSKSILSIPLIYKEKMTGIIYLENRLKSFAFTKQNLKVLDLIVAQSVISIENARLYDNLNKINIQISHLLEVTREMTKAKDKIMASSTALIHLLALLEKIDIKQAVVYLFHQSGNILNAYYLWKDGGPIANPLPYSVSLEKNSYLKNIADILISEGLLVIIIKSRKRNLAILEIECYVPFDYDLIKSYRKFIEGIADSLALTMEHIESEENNRLASIGSMAASIAHDLKNSIGIIMGYSQMAVDDTTSVDTRKEYLNIISKEASQMLSMAYEILDFCKSEINLNLTEIESEEYLMDLSRTLSPIFKNNNISFECNVLYKGLLKIDTDRIRRVIFNLATNARDALLGANKNDAKFKIEIIKEKNGVSFKVCDNGPGIPEHIKTTIFEPFVTYGKSQGIGLGMAIVKKIIDAHNGAITFITEKNRGTTFNVFIPVEEEILNKTYKKLEEENNECIEFKIGKEKLEIIKNKRILLVDDNPIFREMVSHNLRSQGLIIYEAENGKKALDILKKFKEDNNPFHAAIIDKQLPGMDGKKLGKKIKESQDLKNTLLIMIIDNGERGEAEIAKEIGFSAYLSKPINISQIINCLVAVFTMDKDNPTLITRYTLINNKKNAKILLAEDNVTNQKLILRFLNKLGYEADIVGNGKEAIFALEKICYDIVLMDVQMPHMDGFEATKIIRNIESKVLNHKIPIIAMTGYTMKEDIEKCIEIGMNDCISKPVKIEKLSLILDKYL